MQSQTGTTTSTTTARPHAHTIHCIADAVVAQVIHPESIVLPQSFVLPLSITTSIDYHHKVDAIVYHHQVFEL